MAARRQRFAYEDLSDRQFEILVVLICQRLFGAAVQGFATGPDGGRDARFCGTAQSFPSSASPWVGTTIIQAKHTNGVNRSFSEYDFFKSGSDNCIIAQEIPRILKLKSQKDLDNYIIFANRRLSAGANTTILQHLSESCGLPIEHFHLNGLESLEILLARYPQIAQEAELDPIDAPLIIDPAEISEVIEALSRNNIRIESVIDDPPTARISLEKKNQLNNMSEMYSKELRRKYLGDTSTIRHFLAEPENTDILRKYEAVADEFQMKIISKRKDYQTFDEVMEYLVDLLFSRDPVLRQLRHKRLTRAMLFYMYWNCDIGETEDAQTN